jgi:hypothetical protein
VRRRAAEQLRIDDEEIDSLLHLVVSGLDVSLHQLVE